MCAIAGIIGLPCTEETSGRMLATMTRRGPDATGIHRDPVCTLLHARLAVIDPEGGALEIIVHDKSEIGGPLNQFSTIGYKFETNGATVLYPERLLRVMSTSAYSATDEAN